MRWFTVALAVAVVGVQADLWLGPSNMPQVMSLRSQLEQQTASNHAARAPVGPARHVGRDVNAADAQVEVNGVDHGG
ncbi:MAG: hypothetical protein ACK5YM_00825, partial [Pseudomonadota bacterium]